MPSASIKKKIPCSKKNLIEMVLDIEKYPEFVPWCLEGKIHEKIDKGDAIEIKADLTIGKSFFRDTYKSFVIPFEISSLTWATSVLFNDEFNTCATPLFSEIPLIASTWFFINAIKGDTTIAVPSFIRAGSW